MYISFLWSRSFFTFISVAFLCDVISTSFASKERFQIQKKLQSRNLDFIEENISSTLSEKARSQIYIIP